MSHSQVPGVRISSLFLVDTIQPTAESEEKGGIRGGWMVGLGVLATKMGVHSAAG